MVKKRPSAIKTLRTLTKRHLPSSADDGQLVALTKQLFHKLNVTDQQRAIHNIRSPFFKHGLSIGSMFSGTEVQVLAGAAVMKVLSSAAGLKPGRPYCLRFSCDNDKLRQTWITEFMPTIIENVCGAPDVSCCFVEAGDMHEATATCCKHRLKKKGRCRIARVTMLIGGFSCKELSTWCLHAHMHLHSQSRAKQIHAALFHVSSEIHSAIFMCPPSECHSFFILKVFRV